MSKKFNTLSIIRNSGVAFGTSGARGLVTEFTPEVCGAFSHAFINVMKQKYKFHGVALAIDNRPSSYSIAQACASVIAQYGLKVNYYGVIPTPALAYKALEDKIPCIMVTGSHIPHDRNGLKFYSPIGEITKEDEIRIKDVSIDFTLDSSIPNLYPCPDAASCYFKRYIDFFPEGILKGKRVGFYEHSSAGRDLYIPIFEKLGAEIVSIGRSDKFIPIDTEAVGHDLVIQAKKWALEYKLDAIFSTDGDGDRPMLSDENGKWLRGDILGLLCAETLNIKSIAIPISCNSLIMQRKCFEEVVLTKIGSPYVLDAFSSLKDKYQNYAGFEANGGFILGSDITVDNRKIKALPTRDALLPILVLLSANKKISSLVHSLPSRFTYSDRIANFLPEKRDRLFTICKNNPHTIVDLLGENEAGIEVKDINNLDGYRFTLNNNVIIHLRSSGNAPELRCYCEADSEFCAQKYVERILTSVACLIKIN